MILPLHEQVRARVRDVLARLHGITDSDLVIPIEYPPNRTLGDLGTPIAFDLARRLRKAPRVIAQELAAALGPVPGIARVEAAPNGYLNVFLDRRGRSEEHTSELQSLAYLVCRLLLEKKK